MKKLLTILAIVCVLAAALSLSVFALTQNGEGVYEIATAEDLIAFKDGANNGTYPARSTAVITADIDMSGVTDWTPFNDVVVRIDGQGHTISGLTYTASGNKNNGLFVNKLSNNNGGGYVKNLKFKDCSLTVTTSAQESNGGIVCGESNRSAVENIELINCSVNFTFEGASGTKARVGMVIGSQVWGYANGNTPVSAVVNTGCTLTVTATNGGTTNVGGIVGHHWGELMTLTNSVSNATITAPQAAQYVFELDDKVYIANCTSTLTSLPQTGNENKRIRAVATADELLAAIADINAGRDQAEIRLLADIDMEGKVWTPITVGDYKGIFDGQGHTISNIHLVHNDVNSGYYGILVNHLSNNPNGTIQNVTLKDCSITVNTPEGGATGELNIGGAAGRYNRGHIDGVQMQNVDVTLNGSTSANAYVGGIVGMAWWAGPKGTISIYNCSLDAASSVSAVLSYGTPNVAGILGYYNGGDGDLEIKDCVNSATIKSNHLAGGIVGYAAIRAGDKISNTKNYGTIEGNNIAGGIYGTYQAGNVPTLENVTAGGFVIAPNADAFCHANQTNKTGCKNVAIVNPLTAESEQMLAGYYQLAQAGDTTINLRVVFLANLQYVIDVDALNINIAFTKSGALVKQYNAPLGKEVYKTVIAAGDSYTAPDNMILFGNVITAIPTAEVDGIEVTVTDGEGTVVFNGGGIINPDAKSIEDTTGGYAWSAPFEASGGFGEFANNMGFIYAINGDGYSAVYNEINDALKGGSAYAVVNVDGVAYRCGAYDNAEYATFGILRLEIQSAGAVIYSGLGYKVQAMIYKADNSLWYYTNEYTVTATQTSSNAAARESYAVTLPEGLTKLTVDTTTLGKDGINVWNEATESVAQMFDGTNSKMGGSTSGTVTVTFSLTEAATVSYYTLTTGSDTATYTDRNPKNWTLYGKVGNEWVVLSDVADSTTHITGITASNDVPHSYAVTNKQECKEYKIVFSTNGTFQMNELELYAG